MADKRHPEYDPLVVETLDQAASQRLRLAAIADRLKAEAAEAIAGVQTDLAEKLASLNVESSKLDLQIVRTISDNQKWLMPGKLRSFATTSGVYRLTEVADAIEVDMAQKKAIMATARKHGLTRKIANPPRGGYSLSKPKLLDFVTDSGENYALFADFLDQVEGGDRVNLRPNSGQLVDYNGQRLTPPATTIGRISRPTHRRKN